MRICWYGHACFGISAGEGSSIVIDPYEPNGFDGRIGYGAVRCSADIVVVTHDHIDHSHVTSALGSPQVVRKSQTVMGLEFRMLSAYHDQSAGAEMGITNVVTFNCQGIRVCHLGDVGCQLTEEQLKQLGTVDVLMCPVGGVYTVGPGEAWLLAKRIRPRLLLPMHYRNERCHLDIAYLDDFLSVAPKVTILDSCVMHLQEGGLGGGRETEVVALEAAM